jgi:cobalt/nickel transport system permease protein
MYIPESLLGLSFSVFFYILMIPLWIIGIIKSKENFNSGYLPLILLGASFSLMIQMLTLPFWSELPANLTSVSALSILLGPWTSLIIISFALFIKFLIVGEFGIKTFAVNAFGMAFITSFMSYYLYRLFNKGILKKYLIAGVSGYLSSIIAVIFALIVLELQFVLSNIDIGRNIFVFYGLQQVILTMLISHLIFFSLIEGVITALLVGLLTKDNDFSVLDNVSLSSSLVGSLILYI